MIKIGKEHQLFLDDVILATTHNINRGLHRAEKHPSNPLLKSSPADSHPLVFGSVIPNEVPGYDMWYASGRSKRSNSTVNHAVSEDGIVWRYPQDNSSGPGEGKPQVVFGSDFIDHFAEVFTVLRDYEDDDPGRRFKMVFKTKQWDEPSPYVEEIFSNHQEVLADLESRGLLDLVSQYRKVISDALYLPTQKRAAGMAFFSDGIQWSECDSFAIPAIGDLSHVTWDPYRKQYLIFARDFFLPEDVHEKFGDTDWYREHFWGRAVRLYSSTDFAHWTPGEIVMHADIDDRPGDEIYSMAVFPYEGLYVGLIQMYHTFPGDQTLDIQLAVSRDATHWQRVGNREVFLSLGEVGEWDRFNHSVASSPVIVDDEIRIYYGGRTCRHPASGEPFEGTDTGPEWSGIGLATVKRDRFVYLEASFDGGYVETEPLILPQGDLHVNAQSRFGSVKVTVSDGEGKPIPGGRSKPASEDSLDAVVEWDNATLKSPLAEQPVRLRFELNNARLYSFWVE